MVHMTCVHHFSRLIQAKTQIDHLVPCISSYPFMSHSHSPNYTFLSLIFCAIPFHINYVVCVHQGMPWLRAQTMTCLTTRAIMDFWPKILCSQINQPCRNWTSNWSWEPYFHLLFALIHELYHAYVPYSSILHFSQFWKQVTKMQGQGQLATILDPKQNNGECNVSAHATSKIQRPPHQNLGCKIMQNSILPFNLIGSIQQMTNTLSLYK